MGVVLLLLSLWVGLAGDWQLSNFVWRVDMPLSTRPKTTELLLALVIRSRVFRMMSPVVDFTTEVSALTLSRSRLEGRKVLIHPALKRVWHIWRVRIFLKKIGVEKIKVLFTLSFELLLLLLPPLLLLLLLLLLLSLASSPSMTTS